MGIEPTYSAWKAEVLPLNYTRSARRPARQVSSPVQVAESNHPQVKSPESNRDDPRLSATLWFWWRGKDSNLRRHKPADLQSAPVGRLGTPPRTESRVFSGERAAVSIQNESPVPLEALMETRKLGRQGLEVAALGLGCMGMSAFYKTGADAAECEATLVEAVETGVTLFDTAEVYGPYTNEELLGRVLGGSGALPARQSRAGHQVRLRPGPVDGRRLGTRQPPRPHPGSRRAVLAPAQDRPDRPALPAPGGPQGADRGRRRDHGGAGPGGQGPVPRAVGGERHDAAAGPRRAPDQRPPVRIFPFRTGG